MANFTHMYGFRGVVVDVITMPLRSMLRKVMNDAGEAVDQMEVVLVYAALVQAGMMLLMLRTGAPGHAAWWLLTALTLAACAILHPNDYTNFAKPLWLAMLTNGWITKRDIITAARVTQTVLWTLVPLSGLLLARVYWLCMTVTGARPADANKSAAPRQEHQQQQRDAELKPPATPPLPLQLQSVGAHPIHDTSERQLVGALRVQGDYFGSTIINSGVVLHSGEPVLHADAQTTHMSQALLQERLLRHSGTVARR